MPDGTTVDGVLVPIHAQTDFPLGSIEPDGVTIQTRDVAVSPLTKFISSTAHQLQSGQSSVLSLGSGTMPSFIYAGQTYYIGVDDNYTIQLYQNSLDAKSGTNPIYLQSILNSGTITLTDARPSNLLTAINLQSTPPITIDSPNELAFTVGSGDGFSTALPSPLVSGATYFGQSLDSTNIQVYSSIVDAQNGTNPVLLTGNSGLFNTDIRKAIAPQTIFSFAVQHYYLNGDQVQAFTSGGTLPTPLIAGQNYFVNVITTTSISLHESQADALASTSTALVNPIVLTDNGTGTNSLVKLIPATSSTGTTSQITAAGLNISTPSGSGANYQAVVVGSVVGITVTSGGTKYTTAPQIKFSDPPSPPTGSGQSTYPATGYAVMVPDAVGSTTYAVGSVVITSAGLGYSTPPSITIGTPAGYGGYGATLGTATFASGAVTSIPVVNSGANYSSPPFVVITGGAGTGASATAVLQGGSVAYITVDQGGTGYTSAPTVSLAVGTLAVATSQIQTSFVSKFTKISGGSKYITPPKVTITGGGGSGATATATINTGSTQVSSLTSAGTTATATTALAHGFTSGQVVNMSGASPDGYNGDVSITIPPLDTNVSQIDSSSTIATAITTASHGYSTGDSVVISGASPSGYNGTFTILTIPTVNSFTYAVPSGLTSLATGSILSTQTRSISAISGTGTVVTVTTTDLHNYTTGDRVTISGVTPSGYNASNVVITVTSPTKFTYANTTSATATVLGITQKSNTIVTLSSSGTTAVVTTTTNHNYITGNNITIAGASSSGYNGTFSVTVIDSTHFSYPVASGLVTPPTGTITCSIPNPNQFTYTVSAGLTTPATGDILVSSGEVTAINIVTQGTGYTSTPTVTITPSTGVFVEFTSTGTLPAPLVAGTAYRAETPINSSTGTFTVTSADFSPITITSSPTGNFFVALTRPFSISFNNNWSGDFSGITTGQGVYLASDYLLPTGVNNTTLYYMRVINSSTAQLYDTLAHANGSPSTTGIIVVTALGVGQGYFAVRIPSYAKAYNNLVVPSSIEYLSNGELVKFSSTGSLPYPLVTGTDYKITLSGNNVSLTDTSNNPIVFENSGVPTLPVGQMSMDIVRTFTPVASTSIDAVGSLFEIGDQVTVRPADGDILPTGLVASSMVSPQYYYARPVDANTFELYDTYANAVNTTSTTGRITFYNIGNSVSSTFFVDSILPPTLVKSVLHVEKPETLGYVSLYALDYGRSNDMALIGQYHPTETNPKYRRIRIGQQCSWARIIYRMAHPDITSKYDYIPLENERAIIAAVHACDLEDKDFAEQAQRYWGIALGYLRNQNESMEGHAMQPPQINNITYGDYTDVVMF
jgi:hypothetical protein